MFIERIKQGFWRLKQPLTRVPAQPGTVISDLFIWRNSPEWQTFFELTDLVGLFDGTAEREATFCFFDQSGKLFGRHPVTLHSNRRITLPLADFVAGHGEIGSFAVFHSDTPSEVSLLGSFLAERGYLSYCYRKSPLRSYVHGNLDAVALIPGGELELLGGSSISQREYRLQHALQPTGRYELAIVNPTSRRRRLTCQLLSVLSGKPVHAEEVSLAPCGSHVFSLPPVAEETRAVISSRLIMARPVVFRLQERFADVLHG